MEIIKWIFIIGIFLMIAYSVASLFRIIRRNITLPKIKKFFSKGEILKRSKKDMEVITMILFGLYLVTPFGILKGAIESLDINVFLGVALLIVFYAMAGFLLLVSPKMLFCAFLLVWVISLFHAYIDMEMWQFVLALCIFITATTAILHDYIKSNKDKEE